MIDAVPRPRRGLRAAGALFLWGLLAAAPARSAEPQAAPEAPPDRSWEALVRRQDGLVLWGRWRPGTLTLREETLRWVDRKDPGRSLVVPLARIVSHRRVCRDPRLAASCFEWSLRTRDGEHYVFRSGLVEGAPGEIYAAVAGLAPAAAAETATGAP